jgi:hypothetical protein
MVRTSSRFDDMRVGLGLALVLVGAPVAWIMRDVLHGGRSPIFSFLILVAGILFMANYTQLRRGRLYASLPEAGIVLAPFMIIIILAIVPMPFGLGGPTDTRQLIETGTLIAITLAAFSQPLARFRHAHRVTAVFGCLVVCGSLYYAIASAGSLGSFLLQGRFGGFGELNNGDSSAPITIGRIALTVIAAAWIWYRERPRSGNLPAVFFVAAVITAVPMFLLASSRTTMLGAGLTIFMALLAHAMRKRPSIPVIRRRRAFTLTRTRLAILLLATGAFAASASFIYEKFLPLIFNGMGFLLSGGLSLLSGSSGGGLAIDASAATRRAFYAQYFDTFNLVGHGYKAIFVDNPVAEAFYDLGLVGGFSYVIVVLVLPTKICLNLILRRNNPAIVNFSLVMYGMQLPMLFLSTTTYTLNNWVFIVVFYVIAGRFWTVESSAQNTHKARDGLTP